MTIDDRLFPRGVLSDGPWEVVVDARRRGWQYAGLRVAALDGEIVLPAGPVERIVVPLSGAFDVVAGNDDARRLRGRRSVFDGPTDVLYAGIGTALRIEGAGRVAVAEAPATRSLPPRLLPMEDVPVEIRGAGASTRQVHNFGVPGVLEAEKLIVCEVVTPADNWSSYPPHRHDRETATESRLEEVYYFEAAAVRGSTPSAEARPFGLFTAYPSDARPIEIGARVGPGDVALVPHGYHGPAAAAPGYDLYYLNVMAGPAEERAWRITDDPAHGWIRSTWADQAPDPRLPRLREDAPS